MTSASYDRINSNTSSEREMTTWRLGRPRVRDEFRCHNLTLCHDTPGLFGRAQCGTSPFYLIWRFVWAVYHVTAIATSGYLQRFYATRQENQIKWFIFLTNWCYLILTCSAILDLIIAVHFYLHRQDFLKGVESPLPWYCKLSWTMNNISNAIGIEISLIYWILLHEFSRGFDGPRILPFLTHGMNIIYIVANLLVIAMPVRLFHFYQPALFGILYIIFNLVYTITGGSNDRDEPYVYSILDWNDSPKMAAVITAGAALAAIFVHVIVYFIYLFRIFCCRSCQSSSSSTEVMV